MILIVSAAICRKSGKQSPKHKSHSLAKIAAGARRFGGVLPQIASHFLRTNPNWIFLRVDSSSCSLCLCGESVPLRDLWHPASGSLPPSTRCDAVLLQPAVERASAQAEVLGCKKRVAVMPRQGAID
jgi:hypothetical protein